MRRVPIRSPSIRTTNFRTIRTKPVSVFETKFQQQTKDVKDFACKRHFSTFSSTSETLKWRPDWKITHLQRKQQSDPTTLNNSTPQTVEYTTRLGTLVQHNNYHAAEQLLNEMKQKNIERNVTIYNYMLQMAKKRAGLIESRTPGAGLTVLENLFNDMLKDGIKPNEYTFVIMLGACRRRFLRMLRWWDKIKEFKLQYTRDHYHIILHEVGMSRKFDLVTKYINMMQESGIEFDSTTYKVLITIYSKAGEIEPMMNWFMKMRAKGIAPDIYIFNSMIYGFGAAGNTEEMARCLERMSGYGVTPDRYSYTHVVCAFIRAQNVDKVFEWLIKMHEQGMQPSHSLLWEISLLLDLSGKSEKLPILRDLFHFNENVRYDSQSAKMMHMLCSKTFPME